MSTLAGIVLAILILMAMGGSDPVTEPLPGPTVPSSAAMTVPNPGFSPHCDYGPNDDDVRGVVKAATPQLPDC